MMSSTFKISVFFVLLVSFFSVQGGWNAGLDSALVQTALKKYQKSFSKEHVMIQRRLGPKYRYHTNLRDTTVHDIRNSMRYAVMLFESGKEIERKTALSILHKLINLQNTDSTSKWYGLWGYYLEEPADKMSPADFNWADFNASLMLMIYYRHGKSLSSETKSMLTRSIRHAAYSIKRRDVCLHYTNIAIKGTFVTLAAGEITGDTILLTYARNRLERLARTIDSTGSFYEYNSPNYARVSMANLTRIMMFIKDPKTVSTARKIHERMWFQLARHWHASTKQLAPPMSRTYRADIGSPLWIQKALDNQVLFTDINNILNGKIGAATEVSYLTFKCPDNLLDYFTDTTKSFFHREIFGVGGLFPYPFFEKIKPDSIYTKILPLQGSSYITPSYAIGSANKSDFWIQRRPIGAYWKSSSDKSGFMQVRLIKDEYDFSSALLYSVQNKNCVLGAINFRSDGGDKHLTLDPIKDRKFKAARLYLQFLFRINEIDSLLHINQKDMSLTKNSITIDSIQTGAIAFIADNLLFSLNIPYMVFGMNKFRMQVRKSNDSLFVEFDLMNYPESEIMNMDDIDSACLVFSLSVDTCTGRMKSCFKKLNDHNANLTHKDNHITAEWKSPVGILELKAGKKFQPIAQQDLLFDERINRKAVPYVRLSKEMIHKD